MNNSKKKYILISAGGTAGHVLPAIEVAKEFYSRGYLVSFFTDSRMYNNIKSKPNFINGEIKLFSIKGRGIDRTNIFKNIITLILMTIGIFQSFSRLIFIRPVIAIGFGGYITVPVLFACYIFRVKIFIHEGNAILGKANKLLYKISKNLMTHFPELKNIDKKKVNYCFVGMPVRPEILDLYKLNYKMDKTINLLITGGSLGAGVMSLNIAQAIIRFPKDLKFRLRVVQQVRKEHIKELRNIYNKNSIKSELHIFINDMAKYLKWSNIVICRCGASTIAENLISGRPSIMIPFAQSAENHQFLNSKLVETKGAGWVITEDKLQDVGELHNKLISIIKNTRKLFDASKLAKKGIEVRSAEKIVEITTAAIIKNKKVEL